MLTWTTMGYSMGLRSIEAAYRSSRDGFSKELSSINAEWDRVIEQRKSSQSEGDEEYADQHGDYLSDQAFDAENGIRLIREAFMLTLYHYWEKQMCSLLRGLEKADHNTICKKVRNDDRLDLSEVGIRRLYLIANTIKHNNGYPLLKYDPSLFAPEAGELEHDQRIGWHTFLRLEDKDFSDAIAAVRASGPGAKWRDDSGIEVYDEDEEGSPAA